MAKKKTVENWTKATNFAADQPRNISSATVHWPEMVDYRLINYTPFLPDASTLAAPWAIMPEALPLAMGTSAPQAAAPVGVQAEGSVAIYLAQGLVMPRAPEWAVKYGYAISCEGLTADLSALCSQHDAVVVVWNSPGGSVSGVDEAATAIRTLATETPIVSVSQYMMGSAAYYMGAQSSAVAVAPSSITGSVGVISASLHFAGMFEQDGVKPEIFAAGEGKDDRIPWLDMTEEGRERSQQLTDDFYAQFVAAVAAGRGVSAELVRDEWGAQVMTAHRAVNAGMGDLISDHHQISAYLATEEGRKSVLQLAALRGLG